jgi:hypothetical protein
MSTAEIVSRSIKDLKRISGERLFDSGGIDGDADIRDVRRAMALLSLLRHFIADIERLENAGHLQ